MFTVYFVVVCTVFYWMLYSRLCRLFLRFYCVFLYICRINHEQPVWYRSTVQVIILFTYHFFDVFCNNEIEHYLLSKLFEWMVTGFSWHSNGRGLSLSLVDVLFQCGFFAYYLVIWTFDAVSSFTVRVELFLVNYAMLSS